MTAMFWLGKSGALFTERERSALEVWVGTGRRSWRHGDGGVLAALVVRRVGWAEGLVWPSSEPRVQRMGEAVSPRGQGIKGTRTVLGLSLLSRWRVGGKSKGHVGEAEEPERLQEGQRR